MVIVNRIVFDFLCGVLMGTCERDNGLQVP
jgi:hypothetical protein